MDMFDGSSAQSSTLTSNQFYVGNLSHMALSVLSDGTAAASFKIQASLDSYVPVALPMTGPEPTITNWSTLTTITLAGIYTVDAGLSWLRAIRPSSESLSIVQVAGN
jgi:hypothetical protein